MCIIIASCKLLNVNKRVSLAGQVNTGVWKLLVLLSLFNSDAHKAESRILKAGGAQKLHVKTGCFKSIHDNDDTNLPLIYKVRYKRNVGVT